MSLLKHTRRPARFKVLSWPLAAMARGAPPA
jgi:hypothetical protein